MKLESRGTKIFEKLISVAPRQLERQEYTTKKIGYRLEQIRTILL